MLKILTIITSLILIGIGKCEKDKEIVNVDRYVVNLYPELEVIKTACDMGVGRLYLQNAVPVHVHHY